MAYDPYAGQGQPVMVEEPAGELDISRWLQVLRRRALLLVAVCVVSVGIQVVRNAMAPRIYQATAILQIERPGPTIPGMESYWMVAWWDPEFFPTQLRLLRSRGIAERVVRNLRLAGDPAFNPSRAHLLAGGEGQPTRAEDDEAAVAGLAGRVLGGLGINAVRETRLVEITYRSTSRELPARIANGVAEAYIDWTIESRSATMGKASTFLAQQIEALKEEIQDKESQLQAYSRRTDIVTMDPGSNVMVKRLEAINTDYINAVSERISAQARYDELLNRPKQAAAETLADGVLEQLRKDQLQLEREYATKLNIYKPEWPAMQELKARIDRGRQNLAVVVDETVTKAREAARSSYLAALRREQSFAAELQRLRGEALQLNSAAVEYNNLQLEVSTRRTLLDEMVRRQSETGVASRMQGSQESYARLVDRAMTPGSPSLPSLKRSVMLGMLFGLAAGLGLVFLLEYLDRTLKTAEDVERVLGLPVLAVIPDVSTDAAAGYGRYGRYARYALHYRKRRASSRRKKPSQTAGDDVAVELLPHSKPRYPACEAYRGMRTALLLSTAEELKTVVITSAMPGEGKTVTAANLAVVMAQLGRRVVLVDGDLRKPRTHEIFGVSNRTGLVSYLAGVAASSTQVILDTPILGLSLIPSGPIPPNPSELLSSEKMHGLLTLLRQSFDFVVIDTPPVLAVTDATVLGAQVDGVVMCVGAGLLLREDAVAGRDRMAMSGVKVLGVTLNRFHPVRERYGRRYRYYERYYSDGHADSDSAAAAS